MFNQSAFNREKFEPRTEEVRLDALAEYFEGDPTFIVRGLNGQELYQMNEVAERRSNIKSVVEALGASEGAGKVEALREAMGIADGVTIEMAKRQEMLLVGCTEPKLDRETVLRLANNFPIEFTDLTNKITRLTGQGQVAIKKPSNSGPITASAST